ncbi:MAG: DUF1501 domain-containing protein [Planctomycetota bacterium]
MNFNRRQFLKTSLVSGVALGALSPMFRSPFLRRSFGAAMLGVTPRKMVVIFMRGGNDGVNTCIPYGDNQYNSTTRPQLFIPSAQALDLGNGFAALHPALAPLHELHLAGDLATIHRVAYENQSRSHFDSQQYWENGIPGDSELDEGWLYRQVIQTYNLGTNPIAAASITPKLMLMLRGSVALPHITDLSTYNLDVPGATQGKLLGAVSTGGGDAGSGLLGLYGKTSGSYGYDALLGSSGMSVGSTLQAISAAGVDPATYVPENGATYPSDAAPGGFPASSFPFFQQLRDAAMLLKQTDMRIVGIEIDGFDTHVQQGAVGGAHAQLLSQVAHGMRSLSLDLQSLWDDTLIVTLSEFGRTSEENASLGTDHGEAACLFVAGGSVNGGVYNCDASTWANGDLFSDASGRYVAHRTDFRAVLREILVRHFDTSTPVVEQVFPGISATGGDPLFADLGFLPL